MEKLNAKVAEGDPLCCQKAGGLKIAQFIRTPKTQAKWYIDSPNLDKIYLSIRGKKVFGWSDSEARPNAKCSRIAKVAAYPHFRPASRQFHPELLCWWEKCAQEGSCITNHAASFKPCSSKSQEKMGGSH